MNGSRIALPWIKVTKVLGELHEGSSGGLMEINKFPRLENGTTGYTQGMRWHQLCDTYTAS
jgi:hypothetical protein